MTERLNGRISEALASHRFQNGEDLRATLHRYIWLYNHQLPKKSLDYKPSPRSAHAQASEHARTLPQTAE